MLCLGQKQIPPSPKSGIDAHHVPPIVLPIFIHQPSPVGFGPFGRMFMLADLAVSADGGGKFPL